MMNDENAAQILCGHSERLAIAFNLIQRPVPSVIQITKNLRVCGDCRKYIRFHLLLFHEVCSVDEVTKRIAMIRQIEIIVRDANRIHHFYRNGQCSCQDHF